MKRELREQRDAAAQRHDDALARHPNRDRAEFQRELQVVVDQLRAIAKAADEPAADPIEVARTYRWLGDAYFDLAVGASEVLLSQGAAAYQRAEVLLSGQTAPVERAKLDFNYANTLRMLAGGGKDVGLLEAAATRYESALRAFRAQHLADLAGAVQTQLNVLEPQLRLARQFAALERGQQQLQTLAQRAQSASALELEQVSDELKKLGAQVRPDALGETLDEALAAMQAEAARHPGKVAASQLHDLQQQMEELKAFSQQMGAQQMPAQDSEFTRLASLLPVMLQEQVEQGIVSPQRAAQLRDVLERFIPLTQRGSSLQELTSTSDQVRSLIGEMKNPVLSPSRGTPALASGSGAARASAILMGLKRFLIAEKSHRVQPGDEAALSTDLFLRLARLDTRLQESAAAAEPTAELETEAWQIALDVQNYARRNHVTVASPEFGKTDTHVEGRNVFLSGGADLREVAHELARQDGLRTFDHTRIGDHAQERWTQLNASSVGVFDLRVPPGAERAQVGYELGLALATGKPYLVINAPNQPLPFDISRAIELEPRERAVEILRDGIDMVLGSIPQTDIEPTLGATPAHALEWLQERYPDKVQSGTIGVAFRFAQQNENDAVAFARALRQLLGMLGAHAPQLVYPNWPPSYPASGARPSLFHVMPFGPDWATPVRDAVRQACIEKGWDYSRGDESEAQRIIPGIWHEIGQASAVLVDITGLNVNVALELGLTHVLGRPYSVVSQEGATQRFASIDKVQIRPYGKIPSYENLVRSVHDLLALAH